MGGGVKCTRPVAALAESLKVRSRLPFGPAPAPPAPGDVFRWQDQSFSANAVLLQLHALAYNLGNIMRTLSTPEPISGWLMTTLPEKLINIGAHVIGHAR